MHEANCEIPVTNFEDLDWRLIKLRDGNTRKSNIFDKARAATYNLIVLFYRLIYFHSFYLLVFVFIENNSNRLLYINYKK